MTDPKYKIGDKIWVTNLDLSGFQGRANHPQVNDEGEEGHIIAHHSEFNEDIDKNSDEVDVMLNYYTVAVPGEYPLDGGNKNIQARLINLVEHEIGGLADQDETTEDLLRAVYQDLKDSAYLDRVPTDNMIKMIEDQLGMSKKITS